MKKSLIALAVAGVIAAPAAMADATLYGTISVDYISTDSGNAESNIQADDSIIGVKATSETDAGLMITGEIKTETDFASPTLSYISVGNEMVTLWGGKFGNPADAADAVDFSDSKNATHFLGEVPNAVAVTVAAGGFSAALGEHVNGNANATIAQLGFAAGGFTANLGYQKTDAAVFATSPKLTQSAGSTPVATTNATLGDDREVTGLKVGYAMDMFSANVWHVVSDFDSAVNIASTGALATTDEIKSTGLSGSFTMGNTTLTGLWANDDYDGLGDDDTYGVAVSHVLGGGLKAYAEYSDTDGDVQDVSVATVGMSYSF